LKVSLLSGDIPNSKAIVTHFKKLYTKQEATTFNIINLGLPRLIEVQSQQLIEAVTIDEIKEAIMSCDPSKAPRYDGFNIKCIEHVWSIIGKDFSKYIL